MEASPKPFLGWKLPGEAVHGQDKGVSLLPDDEILKSFAQEFSNPNS